jgi:hypothetical protein
MRLGTGAIKLKGYVIDEKLKMLRCEDVTNIHFIKQRFFGLDPLRIQD